MKRLFLVFNPKAGRGDFAKSLYEVVDLFSRAGYEVVVYPTTAAGDAFTRIRECGTGFDLIVCSGGDGIMNEAVNATMRMENPPTLGYIPSGTTNDFAVSLGLPTDILESARSIISGQPSSIDIGTFGDRFFAYVAAFGWFTDISWSTDQNSKNLLGRAAYFLEGAKQLTSIPSIGCELDIDGEMIKGNFMLGIITNAASVAGFQFPGNEAAGPDDGLFEVIFAHRPKNFSERHEIVDVLRGKQAVSPLVIQRSARRIEVDSAQPCSWTLDGEFGGEHTDVIVENKFQALRIIKPIGAELPAGGQKAGEINPPPLTIYDADHILAMGNGDIMKS